MLKIDVKEDDEEKYYLRYCTCQESVVRKGEKIQEPVKEHPSSVHISSISCPLSSSLSPSFSVKMDEV